MLNDLKYLARVLDSVWQTRSARGRKARAVPAVALGLGLAFAVYGYVPGLAAERAELSAAEGLKLRADKAQRAFEQVEGAVETEVAPLVDVLRRYRNDEVLERLGRR